MSPCSSPASLTVEQVVAAWFPLFGYPLAKAEAAQICQRVAERLHPSSWGVLGRNECRMSVPVPLFPLYSYPLTEVDTAQICQRVAERLRPSSGGVLGKNECTTVSPLRLPACPGGADLPAGSGGAPSQQLGSAR